MCAHKPGELESFQKTWIHKCAAHSQQDGERSQRRGKIRRQNGESEASCREQRGFCLVTKQNKPDCSWCRLVRLVSTWGAGPAGAKHRHWRCAARSQRGWSSWCSARTRTQMLTVLFVEDPAPFFPPRYCLKCFYKYLNSCSQPSEVLVMSVIQRFLQQRKEKQMRSVIFFTPTFPSCHAHVRLGDLLQQVFSTPALDEYFQAASEPGDTQSTYFLLQQIALRKPPLKTLYLSTDDVEQLLTCTTL